MTSIIKTSLDDNRMVLAEVIPLKTPFTIQIEPSSICNFKCNYCIQSSFEMQNKNVMEWSTFLRLCEQIQEFDDKLKQITISGWGEPLINKNLPRMISHLKELNVTEKIFFYTNGSLINRELTLSLINSGVDIIKISLQGMTQNKYFEICGVKIDFERLVNNIRFLYENKKQCEIFIKIADISLNEREDQLFYSTFGDITDRMYIENIRPVFDKVNGNFRIDTNKTITKFGHIHSPIMVCPLPFYIMKISSSGDIYPCCHYYDPTKFGNINNSNLKEIWNGDNRRNFLKMLLSKNRNTQKKYPICNNCKFPDMTIVPGDELDSHTDKISLNFQK